MPRNMPFILAIAFCINGCNRSPSPAPEVEPAKTAIGSIHLDTIDLTRLGIEVSPVRHQSIEATKSAVGWLEAAPATQHVVRAQVTGFVVSSKNGWPVLGQAVRAGDSLATLNVFLTPQEVSQLVIAKEDNDAQMQQALVTMQLSEAQLQQVMSARDAVTGVRIDQLKESLAHSKAAYKEAQEKLPYLIEEPTPDGLLVKPVPVASSIDGRVIRIHVTAGQFVVAGDPLWMVSDWSRLWLRVPLFELDAERLGNADLVQVHDHATGAVKTATRLLVPTESKTTTRTIDHYYAIDNADLKLRVGQALAIEFPLGEDRESIVIPRSAVLYSSFGQPSCFVSKTEHGIFARKSIELGVSTSEFIEVVQGLNGGDEIVTVGAQQLAAEESKADLAVEDDD